MPLDLGDLWFKLGADTSGLNVAEREAKKFTKRTEKDLRKVNKATKRLDKQTKKLGNQYLKTGAKAKNSLSKMSTGIRGLKGTMLGLTAVLLGAQWLKVNREFQSLGASLETVTGSSERAEDAFDWIKVFAAKTPYQLSEVVTGFNKLTALGLEPSADALRAYGNVASGMSKSLDQFIEAVADASVGEFERLKEFGIKSRNQGETIKFLFKGITTVVKNEADEIAGYLRGLGETEFAGGMERQMDTLNGKISNMTDAWEAFMRSLDDHEVVGNAITNITHMLQVWSGDEQAKALDKMRELQEAQTNIFDEIKTTKNLNFFGVFDNRLERFYREHNELNDKILEAYQLANGLDDYSIASKATDDADAQDARAFKFSDMAVQKDFGIDEDSDKLKTKYLLTAQERKLQILQRGYDKQLKMAKKYHLTDSANFLEYQALFEQAYEEISQSAAERKLEVLTGKLLTEEETLQRHYELQLEQLAEAEQLKIDTLIPYQELRERLEEQHLDKLNKLKAKHDKDETVLGKIKGFNLSKLRKQVNKESEAESGKAFSNSINQAAQHNKAFFNMQKALAMAQALIDGPAAILSSFKYGSSLGGPPLGALFAGIAAASTAVQIAAISSSSYTGKAVGGNVFAGGMYRVNENGPEMLSAGGQDYLMMGSQGGNITPNNKLGGSSKGGVIVNITTLPGETASVESSETDEGTQIDVMIERIEGKIAEGIATGGSPVADAVETQYGLNRSLGAVA